MYVCKRTEELSDDEKKQRARYLYPLQKRGISLPYLKKMKFVERLDLSKDCVFSSPKDCYKELFTVILITLGCSPTYSLVDATKLAQIDNGYYKDRGCCSLDDLSKKDVLFIRCGFGSLGFGEDQRNYIDVVVANRRVKGKRTYIFNYGTPLDFKKWKVKTITNIVPVVLAEGAGGIL